MSEGSDERPNACMIYLPTKLYVGLIKKMAKYEIGKSAALLDAVNNDLHNEGFIDDDTHEEFKQKYRKPLIEVVREKEEPSIKVEVNAAKIEVQQSKVSIRKHVDYSKMDLDQLKEEYRRAINEADVAALNLIQFEARNRGFRFKDDNGNIKVVNITKK